MAKNLTPIQGTSGDDRLNGTENDDTFYPVAGNDIVNGEQGRDTVVYQGLSTAFTLQKFTASVVVRGNVTVVNSESGTPVSTVLPTIGVLNQVERIRFDDKIYLTDTKVGDHAWQVAALYTAAGVKVTSIDQTGGWLRVADDLNSLPALANQIIKTYAPGISDSTFVSFLWGALTGTSISADNLVLYSSMIGTGKTFADQGALFAAAASLPDISKFDNMVSIIGTLQSVNVSDYGI